MHFWVYYTTMFLHPVIFCLFVLVGAKCTYMGVSDYGISEFHSVSWFLLNEVAVFSNDFSLGRKLTYILLFQVLWHYRILPIFVIPSKGIWGIQWSFFIVFMAVNVFQWSLNYLISHISQFLWKEVAAFSDVFLCFCGYYAFIHAL